GENGLLGPIMDETALAEAICRLIEDRELAERLGRNAAGIADIANGEEVFESWKSYLESL
ncbi:MAG: glycosyltransferase family 4 protein, partial [Eisenbergiella sp.]